MAASWIEKREQNRTYQIKKLSKKFADIPEGSQMFIATPKIIEDYMHTIPPGYKVDMKTLRNDLALQFGADYTCPVTSGIYLRIVAEAACEELKQGKNPSDITPFWRAIDVHSKVASKLSCGISFLAKQQRLELE